MGYYRDTTAWIAIANVERERRQQERKHEPAPKKEYKPQEPVDAFKVIHAEHKKVNFNKALWFTYKFKKALDEKGNRTTQEQGIREDCAETYKDLR